MPGRPIFGRFRQNLRRIGSRRLSENRAGFEGIELIAAFDRDSSTAERDEVLRLAGLRCPVSDNLGNATPVIVRLAAPAELAATFAPV
ncbi:hypothetical protein [Cryobacterium sp. M23]|uniref:hypothetical protein n=1 Tax=Cryobacterium sp. M23 TaxID=2048292 RepID=UPI000CE466FF|nr:hypothetical protein [Cryobacterium sp. M23]